MKRCPFCWEKIQDSAKKCRFCGERIEEKEMENKKAEEKRELEEKERKEQERMQIFMNEEIKEKVMKQMSKSNMNSNKENNYQKKQSKNKTVKKHSGWYISWLFRFVYADKNRVNWIQFFEWWFKNILVLFVHSIPILLLVWWAANMEYTSFWDFLWFLVAILWWIIAIFFIWSTIKLIVNRRHDLWYEWRCTLINIFLPIVTLILFFVPWQDFTNKYWENPSDFNLSEDILAKKRIEWKIYAFNLLALMGIWLIISLIFWLLWISISFWWAGTIWATIVSFTNRVLWMLALIWMPFTIIWIVRLIKNKRS